MPSLSWNGFNLCLCCPQIRLFPGSMQHRHHSEEDQVHGAVRVTMSHRGAGVVQRTQEVCHDERWVSHPVWDILIFTGCSLKSTKTSLDVTSWHQHLSFIVLDALQKHTGGVRWPFQGWDSFTERLCCLQSVGFDTFNLTLMDYINNVSVSLEYTFFVHLFMRIVHYASGIHV